MRSVLVHPSSADSDPQIVRTQRAVCTWMERSIPMCWRYMKYVLSEYEKDEWNTHISGSFPF